MKKQALITLVFAAVLIAACGGTDVPVEIESSASVEQPADAAPQPELAISLEDIVGRWQGIKGGGGFVQIEGNGAWTIAYELDELDNPETVWGVSEVQFEESQLFITESVYEFGIGEICDNTGIYQVYLLAGGNLRFVVIEDECVHRVGTLQGEAGINVEWKPVS
jgi:hypothetical protein